MTGLQVAPSLALSLARTQACVLGRRILVLGITPGETSPILPPHVRKSCLNLLLQSGPVSFRLILKFFANWLEREGSCPALSEQKLLLSAVFLERLPLGDGCGKVPRSACPGSDWRRVVWAAWSPEGILVPVLRCPQGRRGC